jgi:hypothetical protein
MGAYLDMARAPEYSLDRKVLRYNAQRLVPQWAESTPNVVGLLEQVFEHHFNGSLDYFFDAIHDHPYDHSLIPYVEGGVGPGVTDGSGCAMFRGEREPRLNASYTILTPLRLFLVVPEPGFDYCLYTHGIAGNTFRGGTKTEDEIRAFMTANHYVGVSNRPWFTRYREHLVDAERGVARRLHTAIREFAKTHIPLPLRCVDGRVRPALTHVVIDHGLSKDEAFDLEEEKVVFPGSLNMIPGGYAGIELLAKLGYPKATTPKERDAVLLQVMRDYSSNAMSWWAKAVLDGDQAKIDAYFEAHPGWLAPEQVRFIRAAAESGMPITEIASRLDSGAKHKYQQVERVLNGETYGAIT